MDHKRFHEEHVLPDEACPFCSLQPDRLVAENRHALAVYDGFPVSSGHMLIVPKRHMSSFFETSEDERTALFDLLAAMRENFIKEHGADGFNIGINEGAAAGQTVMHLHIHLIPRFFGDMTDPRGGIRWIFPDKAAYWNK